MKNIQSALRTFLVIGFLIGYGEEAKAHADYVVSDGEHSIERSQDKMPDPVGTSESLSFVPAPYLGYSDTYGFLSGVAGVLYNPDTQTRLTTSVITDFNAYFRYRLRFDWIEPEDFMFTATAAIGNDYQDYYGEGDATPNIYTALTDQYDQFTASFQKCIDAPTGLYMGPLVQYVNRAWQGSSPFPNESEWRLGYQATRDTRDNILESHEGSYFQLGTYTEPASGNDGVATDVIQVETDSRLFLDLDNDRVLALRANSGWTLVGDPSYSFVYTLGGLNELRGYHSNRFRGKYFYGLQAELRFPIFSWLNGSTSLDGGDITDTQFGNFLLTYQVGLRTDVLLKEGVVFRVDFGIGADQNEVQFNISEPF